MGRLYDANGAKMNVTQACTELQTIMTHGQATMMNNAIKQYIHLGWKPNKIIAHAVLDSYVDIESTSETGQRVRKIMDWLMTKYQKSSYSPTAEDTEAYNNLIATIQKAEE